MVGTELRVVLRQRHRQAVDACLGCIEVEVSACSVSVATMASPSRA